MARSSTSFADLPRLPVGCGETAERIFAQAADDLNAARHTEPSLDPLHVATTRHLGGEARGPWRGPFGDLLAEVQRARGIKVALGPYDVLRCIGRGGMGVVYEAVHRTRGQRVALKTLQQMTATALYRFKNEFRSAQSVVHENLCALYELVSWQDDWFFTMEYVEGASFTEHIRGDSRRFDEARLRAALLQLARGVQALHDAGKLHRDLNPSNVLVTQDGRVVILDFGLISGEPQGRRQTGAFDVLSGTPGYMAPEQVAGEPASTASDWYSVGVMLYEALTGRIPFMGSTRRVLIAKSTMDATPPAEHCPYAAIPDDLDGLCRALVRRAPRERPLGKEVLRLLGGDEEPMPLGHPALGKPLIGREEQLLALMRAYLSVASASASAPAHVHVHGPSGMGKTALVQSFLAAFEEGTRALIFRGRCYERESVPHKTLDSLLDALANHLRSLPEEQVAKILPPEFHDLARVFPVLQGVPWLSRVAPARFEVRDAQEIRRRAFVGLAELLRRLGATRPLILFIDDVQWGDLDSAARLSELLEGPVSADSPSPPRLLLITAGRSEEAPRRRSKGEASKVIGIEIEIPIRPLCHKDAIKLALRCIPRTVTGDVGAAVEGIARESDGSPFLIAELARYAEQVSRRGGDLREVSLERLVEARLGRLGESAQALLAVIVTAGKPIEQGLAIEASGVGPSAHAALVRLRGSQLIRAQGFDDADRVECSHDRLRDAALAAISPEALRGHHLRLARALSTRARTAPEDVAHHFAGAGLLAEAARFAELAAARAEVRLAFDRAAELYAVALSWTTHAPERASSLLAKQADALVHAGRGAEAAPLYLSAAQGAPEPRALDLRRRAAEHLLLAGRVKEGVSALGPVLSAHGLAVPDTQAEARLAELLRLTRLLLRGTHFRPQREARIEAAQKAKIRAFWAAGRGLLVADPVAASAYVTETLLLALEAGDLDHIIPGMAFVGALSMAGGAKGAVAQGIRLLEQAEALSERTEDPYLLAFTAHCWGRAHYYEGRFRRGLLAMDRCIALLRAHNVGTLWEQATSRAIALQALLSLGELTECSRRAHAWLLETNESGDEVGGVSAEIQLAFDHLRADNPEAAREGARKAIQRAPQDTFSFQHHVARSVETLSDLYQGHAPLALGAVEDELRRTRIYHVQSRRIEMLYRQGIIAVAAGAKDAGARPRLCRLALSVASSLEQEERAHASAAAALIRAGVAWGERRPVEAAALLRVAAERYDAAEMKLLAACARRKLGELEGEDALIAAADAALRAEGVAAPERWARMYTSIGD